MAIHLRQTQLTTKNEHTKETGRSYQHPRQSRHHARRAARRDDRIDNDKNRPAFGRADAIKNDFELAGGSDQKKGVHHEAGKDGSESHEPECLTRQHDRVAAHERAQKHEVQKVIHVVAPAHEAFVTDSAYSTVQCVGRPLRRNERRDYPQPREV